MHTSHVDFQRGGLGESFTALVTFKRSLTSVGAHVLLQKIASRESLVAVLATVRFHACVNFQMIF